MDDKRISNWSNDSGVVPDIIESEYNMSHKYRGTALIFNNEHFDNPNLRSRSGTHMDSEKLEKVLMQLGFEVKEYMDLCKVDILRNIKRIASKDHTDNDCLVVVILSHGLLGHIHARDSFYSLENIWKPFAANQCPSLAGKPKLFFIQACQGEKTDPGYNLMHQPEMCENDVEIHFSCRLPMDADFLISFSTMPGYCSWRNTVDGSWFIQSLCDELATQGMQFDILTLMTMVARRVAFNFESYDPSKPTMHQKKQIPCTMSTLTRLLYFRDKSETFDNLYEDIK